jgi:hypothetical protein
VTKEKPRKTPAGSIKSRKSQKGQRNALNPNAIKIQNKFSTTKTENMADLSMEQAELLDQLLSVGSCGGQTAVKKRNDLKIDEEEDNSLSLLLEAEEENNHMERAKSSEQISGIYL